MKRQNGASLVEFALAALLFFIILFGVIEFARFFYVYNTLVEATRRGARTAVVCPPNDINGSTAKITNVVLFNAPNATGNGILNLSPTNITIEYLLPNMTAWTYNATNINGVVVGNIDQIAFVRVSILGFQHTVFIPLPFFNTTFTLPPTATQTTLPRESLGRLTADNPLAAANRNCF